MEICEEFCNKIQLTEDCKVGLLDSENKGTMNNSVYARANIPINKRTTSIVQTDEAWNDDNALSKTAKPEKERKGIGFGKLFDKKGKGTLERKEQSSPIKFAYPGKKDTHACTYGIPSREIPSRNNRNIPQIDDNDNDATELLFSEKSLFK
jgi:hypothetical protein